MLQNNIPVQWYPTDPHPPSRQAIQERIDLAPTSEIQACIHKPMSLSLTQDGFHENEEEYTTWMGGTHKGWNVMVCINMIHISPWEATVGLFLLAHQQLVTGGILYCYGPYKEGGTAVASNLAFDESLKARNAEWGVRDLEVVVQLAEENGLELEERIEMPANNLSLIFRKK